MVDFGSLLVEFQFSIIRIWLVSGGTLTNHLWEFLQNNQLDFHFLHNLISVVGGHFIVLI